MPAPRKVLMVALRYPPASGAGTIQTLKHQKYLPLHGWVGDTLTGATNGRAPSLSREPALEGPGETFRVRFPDPLRAADRYAEQDAQFAARGLRRLARYALAPDGQALFVPAALHRAATILDDYDVLYASGMPWSGLLAAAALKVRCRRPLVVGLRDPWVEPDGVRYGRWRNRVESALERAALRAADAVLVTAAGLHDELLRRRPWLAGKVHVIPNGYDEEDFQGLPAQALGTFDLVHTGNFYGTKGPEDLFEAVARWLEAHPGRRSELRVRLVGPARPADREAVGRCGLEDVVVFEGAMRHVDAVARVRTARALVAVDYGPDQARTRVLSKSFEYMRAGRPILFLSSGGNTEDVLRPCPRAVIVRKGDAGAAAAALERIASGSPPPPEFVPDPYTRGFERSLLAGRFADVLSEVSASDPPRG